MKLYDKDGNELDVEITSEMFRQAAREGMKDWMEEHYATVGKWTISCLAFFAFGALIYFIIWATGLSLGGGK